MGSNVIIGIIIAIIIVAAVLYLVGHFMRKKNQERLDLLEKRREDLFDLPVVEEVDDVKRMHLVGQSQNTFREWRQKWTDISTTSFADLETKIFEVENLNENLHFLKGKKMVIEAEETMDEMETQVAEIRAGLRELRESEERNSLEVQKALDVYEELKNGLKEDSSVYGPAYSELQKQIKNIEIEFTQFVTLNTSGDPIEAREVLEQAERHTYEVDDLMKRIPPLYEELSKTYPDQLKEIEDGYKRMIEQYYVFPETNFADDIKRAKKRVENSMSDLEKAEVESVEVANIDTANSIDALYDILEREIEAKKYVVQSQKVIQDYIDHATKNNRQLLIELDHTSQSYTLNHNQVGRARGFQTEVDELSRRNSQMEPLLAKHEVAYSDVQQFYKNAFKILDDIEAQQVEIDESLRELRKGEKVAQEKIEKLEFSLRNLKRFVEKQRLPGLPGDYLEFFFVATDRLEELSRALNRMRINMEEINKLVNLCEEDLELLEKRTYDLVDAAALTEQMMQYANRYRHTHPEIRQAIEKTLVLFSKEYRYQDALDEIGTALEHVESGAFKRIETFYFNNQDLA
ncbi:septation ring formation regulator EzrA [Enterococcus sp. JM4C]|uniref:septation ring formation regulator EzrA n=1 Tax=Candidatus Enterococcus huntleyi TaxID=1857217 RepID=UPI00137A5E61|nr:septation ring formation regulator EzrA [Enterococcus sp. JM4C]KAF1296140.1 septation ring formation regulator EzrA [Enterococcus sp. JM4C]